MLGSQEPLCPKEESLDAKYPATLGYSQCEPTKLFCVAREL